MFARSRYAFQSPSVSNEKGAYRMLPPRSSRPEFTLRHPSDPSLRLQVHAPYRRMRRLAILMSFLVCCTLMCFSFAYWLFTTRYRHPSFSSLNKSGGSGGSISGLHALYQDSRASYQPDTIQNSLDEPDSRLSILRADLSTTYLAYLPHSGLHNQRIALENAITLAYLLNRTLLLPPARLGPQTLRYVRSSTLARMLRLSDKRRGRTHCPYIPTGIPMPDECVDYMTYTLVPWAWLVDLRPIEARQTLLRVSNGTEAWIEENLGVRPNETLFIPDTEPYEFQYVDTSKPLRGGEKYNQAIHIDTLAKTSQRFIQLGTLFGSSRLRLRKADNQRVRRETRRCMAFANAALTLIAKKVGEVLGWTYVGVHVRVGDGHFREGAGANVRIIWWKLVRDVLRLDTKTALELEKRVLSRMVEADEQEESEDDGEDDDDSHELVVPPEILADKPTLRVPHPPLPPLPETFSLKLSCRNPLHTAPSLLRLNVPLFLATDASGGLSNPLLAPLIRTFPCTFSLASFHAETAHLEELRNGYDGVLLGGYLTPIMDALVMGGAWAVVGTEGSTFSRYVGDVSWRVSHGWDIVERG